MPAAVPRRGPEADLVQFGRALSQAVRRARIGTLVADADFDAEWVHQSIRSHGIRSIIPPERGRPSDNPPAGRWRRRKKDAAEGGRSGRGTQLACTVPDGPVSPARAVPVVVATVRTRRRAGRGSGRAARPS